MIQLFWTLRPPRCELFVLVDANVIDVGGIDVGDVDVMLTVR